MGQYLEAEMRDVSITEKVFADADLLMRGEQLEEYKKKWQALGLHDPRPCPRCFACGDTGRLIATNKKDPEHEGELLCKNCGYEIDLDG